MKIYASIFPSRSQSKTTGYMFDQSFLQPFGRKYWTAISPVVLRNMRQ